jgi:nucleoporin NDC1
MASNGNSPQQRASAEVMFENDILPARAWSTITRAVVWQIISLFAFCLTRSLLLLEPFSANGSGFPVGWIRHGINSIVHPSSWVYDGLIIGCLSVLGMLYLKNLQTSSKVPQGGGAGLKYIILSGLTASTSNGFINALTSLVAHVGLAALLIRCYIGILGPSVISSLKHLCNPDQADTFCVNESHVFLVMSGAYTGLRAWWKLHGPSNRNVLRFPLIQQSGNTLLRQRIFSELIKELFDAGLSLRWFCVLYYLLGQRVELFIADGLHIDHRTDYQDDSILMFPALSYQDTFWYYTSLLLHTWTINALLIFNIGLLHAIFSINMTKRIRFPITSRSDSATSQCIMLMDAMKNDGAKSSLKESGLLLKHLAFQDFADLTAAQSKLRRSEFFMLSQPGGHPHHWNEVRSICLNTIADFSQDLEMASKPTSNTVAPVNSASVSTDQYVAANANGTPSIPRLRRLGGPQTPLMGGRTNALPGIRSGIQELVPSTSSQLQPGENKTNHIASTENTVLGKLEKYLAGPEKLAAALTNATSAFSLPGGGNSGDAAVRSVYAKGQVVIWAVEGLAHLVAASIVEDRYGVVQKDLPKVIEALLLLQQTVEKHRKGATATARKNRFETRDLQLKQELRIALKSSLFRICVVFGEHLDALPLAADLRKRIMNYQSFAEG